MSRRVSYLHRAKYSGRCGGQEMHLGHAYNMQHAKRFTGKKSAGPRSLHGATHGCRVAQSQRSTSSTNCAHVPIHPSTHQLRYSFRSSYMPGAQGCQMPTSGGSTGSAISASTTLPPFRAGTYSCAQGHTHTQRTGVQEPICDMNRGSLMAYHQAGRSLLCRRLPPLHRPPPVPPALTGFAFQQAHNGCIPA